MDIIEDQIEHRTPDSRAFVRMGLAMRCLEPPQNPLFTYVEQQVP